MDVGVEAWKVSIISMILFILFVIFLWNRIAGVQNRTGAYTPHQPPPLPLNPPPPHMESRVCIHKATLHKKIDFKTDSFLRLFTDIHLGTYWRLPVSFTSRFFYNTYNTYWRILLLPFGAGGGDKEILKGTKLKW
jgi:hypothetical protein